MNDYKTQKLQSILDRKEGVAVAITGAWGVGKTYFWKEFIKNYNLEKRKGYAYISVFGIESPTDLKALIVQELGVNSHDEKNWGDKLGKLLKGVMREMKSANLNGVNISGNIIFSMLFSRVSDSIICIDDMERKSAKLEMRDIMGLVEFLKNQRGCKVVVLLNDKKDDSGIYSEYKEKVFDDALIISDISSVLSRLVESFNDVIKCEFLKFYSCFGLENIRFYKKALRLVEEIMAYLPNDFSESTLTEIVQSVLVFLTVTDIDKDTIDITWEDVGAKDLQSKLNNKTEKDSIKKLKKFYGGYFFQSEWNGLLKSFFLQDHQQWSLDDFKSLAKSDLLVSNQEHHVKELTKLINGFYNFDIEPDFSEKLSFYAEKSVGNGGVVNTCFYISLLKKFGCDSEARKLEDKLLEWVRLQVLSSERPIESAENFFRFGVQGCEDIYVKIAAIIEEEKWPSYSLTDTMNNYINNNGYRTFDVKVVRESTKEDWRRYLFEDTKQDRFSVIKEVLSQQIAPEKQPEIRTWIRDLMLEKRLESVAMGVAVDHMLSLLDKG